MAHALQAICKLECIPVGCVPFATVVILGGVCNGGFWPVGVFPGGVCLGGVSPEGKRCLPDPPPVSRMTDRQVQKHYLESNNSVIFQ